jgi:putative transposase
MKQGQYSPEKIVQILAQANNGDKTITQICQEHNLSQKTFYNWRRQYDNSNASDINKTKELARENARLKRLLAERDLEVDVLKELVEKKFKANQTPKEQK